MCISVSELAGYKESADFKYGSIQVFQNPIKKFEPHLYFCHAQYLIPHRCPIAASSSLRDPRCWKVPVDASASEQPVEECYQETIVSATRSLADVVERASRKKVRELKACFVMHLEGNTAETWLVGCEELVLDYLNSDPMVRPWTRSRNRAITAGKSVNGLCVNSKGLLNQSSTSFRRSPDPAGRKIADAEDSYNASPDRLHNKNLRPRSSLCKGRPSRKPSPPRRNAANTELIRIIGVNQEQRRLQFEDFKFSTKNIAEQTEYIRKEILTKKNARSFTTFGEFRDFLICTAKRPEHQQRQSCALVKEEKRYSLHKKIVAMTIPDQRPNSKNLKISASPVNMECKGRVILSQKNFRSVKGYLMTKAKGSNMSCEFKQPQYHGCRYGNKLCMDKSASDLSAITTTEESLTRPVFNVMVKKAQRANSRNHCRRGRTAAESGATQWPSMYMK